MATSSAPAHLAGITRITVAGFKSLRDETSIDIRPLTVLAGTNSSGKSSMLQPLLLLKQTMELSHDPGALHLDDRHVSFTDFAQLLWRDGDTERTTFEIGVEIGERWTREVFFQGADGLPQVDRVKSGSRAGGEDFTWSQAGGVENRGALVSDGSVEGGDDLSEVRHERWLPWVSARRDGQRVGREVPFPGLAALREQLSRLIHVRAVRERPGRVYAATRLGERYPSVFEPYVPSIVAAWENDPLKRDRLDRALQRLGLSGAVRSKRQADGNFQVRVARLPSASVGDFDFDRDGVDLADVGMGVSQVLPVLVALLAGDHERLVYIEEPELHLHPRAQAELAHVIVEAIDAGARVVIETHSAILLLSLQTLVAKKAIAAELVALHWFHRDAKGVTRVASAGVDEAGRFGDWPVDFLEVELEVQDDFLNAVRPVRGR